LPGSNSPAYLPCTNTLLALFTREQYTLAKLTGANTLPIYQGTNTLAYFRRKNTKANLSLTNTPAYFPVTNLSLFAIDNPLRLLPGTKPSSLFSKDKHTILLVKEKHSDLFFQCSLLLRCKCFKSLKILIGAGAQKINFTPYLFVRLGLVQKGTFIGPRHTQKGTLS
jgi:hypothetical protein